MGEQNITNKKSNKLLIIVIVILLAVCCGLGYMVLSGKLSPSEGKPDKEYTTKLNEFVANLSDLSPTYIKTTITLSYNEKNGGETIEGKLPQIRDCINKFFISKASDSFKSDTIDTTSSELIVKINEAIGSELIKDIYFEQIIIQ